MAMGKRPAARQAAQMWVNAKDLPRSDGHPFFERLNRILAESGFDAFYVGAVGLEDPKAPLFQSADRAGRLSGRPLARRVVLAMIKRRASAAGLPASTCCHTFRATGITAYLSNGGTLEHAQRIAGHASPKTTKLYDRTADAITLDEIERIVL